MELKDIKSLKNMLDFAAEHYGENTFMLYKENGELCKKTYNEFKTCADAFSRMLEENNKKGCHVAVIGPTCFEWVVTYFGTVDTNSVIVPLAANETDDMNCKLCDFADVDILVFDKSHESLYKAMKKRVPRCKLFISLDSLCAGDGVLSLEQIFEDYKGDYTFDPDPDIMCTLMFTSGTTGFPKGVMLTNRGLCVDAMSYNEPCHAMRVFACLPINHAYCFTTNFTKIIFRGATVCVNDNMQNLLANIRLYQPHSIVCVPAIANKLMGGALRYAASRPDVPEQESVAEFLGHPGKIVSGGAPLEAALFRRYTEAGMMVLNGYGMTECSPIIANNTPGDNCGGSVGKPLPCIDLRIVDGEIQVKGPNVTIGYYKNEEATKEAFTQDGYFKTGDLGHFDENGYLYITGRKKNLILLDNGENVSAEFLEGQFAREPLVAEIVCYGKNGAICAEVYPNNDYIKENAVDADEAMVELLGKINARLATHQRISTYVFRSTPFPKNSSQKIIRTGLGKDEIKVERIAPKTPAEKKVCDAVKDVLIKTEVGINENFFAIGGDSLSAAELAVALHISAQVVYNNPFLHSLALALESEEEDDKPVDDINEILKETAAQGEKKDGYKAVLLTGATGFLGIHILKELLDRNIKVYCLVRKKEKLLKKAEYYFGALAMDDVVCVKGDIEKENLGLTDREYNELAQKIDCVFHVAANVHHAGDYSELKKTNVDGTNNIIAFAKKANAVLQHTSTVSVHGSATVVETRKSSVFSENVLDIGQHFADNVYIHSKFRAEEAVILARKQGLQSNIYRIGNLTWRTGDGMFQENTEDNGFLHRIRALLKLGLYNENLDKFPMDLTAVDECARAYVSLALLGNTNEVYHMINTNYLPGEELFKRLDTPYRIVSTLENVETVVANSADRDIRVFLFYMLISGRSANIETDCSFTAKRLKECSFTWSEPAAQYLKAGNHCTNFEKYDVKPMRTTGGTLTPIQNLALGALSKTEIPE
ncbi:MAG: AMP-binding protein, partial [Clostridia bacterium]|nr:AMP-binding protein [Clostridia bacterium]